ncbi:MAG: alpha/beta fold hydrolase [Candidatus Sungbacteria bacterium]|uniref:Alpha/beta fold hydrolase n=1 Tax=Candidatus Sungiibacteriota bacterium TaxID=2750080 RepID=A0A932YVH2_9BACT|nr:alpha/beta fold hydrolase [Candidatus Sungbacteria bacterium]
MPERIEIKTSDDVAIIGDYYAPANQSAKGLLLLHMMSVTRQSWKAFAEKMQADGWHVLAIDLRGHGESAGGPDGYKQFGDAEHQASKFDVGVGVEFLKSRGVSAFSLGGASIGANLALQFLAGHPEAKAAFLLSPGLNYRGVAAEPAAPSLRPGQAVYYVASRDDKASADAILRLMAITPAGVEKDVKLFDTAGHGTTIFERQPEFMRTVATWLDVRYDGVKGRNI